MSLVNHAAGESFIEGFMEDTCLVIRDYGQEWDDTLNETTGQLVPPSNDSIVIYRGKCLVKRLTADKPMDIGGVPTDAPLHKILFPHSVSGIRLDDIVTITASGRNPSLVGVRFRVKGTGTGTHPVYQAVWAQDVTHAR